MEDKLILPDGKERVILNVGGIKFETFRSTLTAYPDTFLGTMFQPRNQELLRPDKNNEYFFDRNGHAFYYIMQFYRIGILPYFGNPEIQTTSMIGVSRKELEIELDYFQIPIKECKYTMVHQAATKLVDGMLNQILDIVLWNIELGLKRDIRIAFFSNGDEPAISDPSESYDKRLFERFAISGHDTLERYNRKSVSKLKEDFDEESDIFRSYCHEQTRALKTNIFTSK
ncbi:hypothetical protein G9A89_001383 [Geosiphon pyriformis]|nr:hypothetical protein G9A89_001383 [Geosiphon pyriformis]